MTEVAEEKIKTPLSEENGGITVQTADGTTKTVPLDTAQSNRLQQANDQYRQDAARVKEQVNSSVNRAVEETLRSREQGEQELQHRRNEIAVDEARAMDNQALTSALQGERGGMQEARQKIIRRTAAKNRRLVADAQQKLAEETAQKIRQLRIDGEYEKAEALLNLNQNYIYSLWDMLVQVSEGLMEPEDVEPAVEALTTETQGETVPEGTAAAAKTQEQLAMVPATETSQEEAVFEDVQQNVTQSQQLDAVLKKSMELGAESPVNALRYLMELMDAGEIEPKMIDYIYGKRMGGTIPASYQEFVDMTGWPGILPTPKRADPF